MSKKRAVQRTIMLFASEVPVISAVNPYRKIDDIFFDVWKRTNPTQISTLQQELQLLLPTPEEKLQSLVRDLGAEPAITALLEEAKAADTTDQVVSAAAKIVTTLPRSTPAALQQEVVQAVASEMHKSFGIKQEAPAIAQYQQQQQTVVKERNLVFSKKKLASVDNYNVYVGGKIDGKADGKVIEVKNRLKRFLTPLPKYDVVQLQTYLFILGVSRGELVEHLRADVTQTRLTNVDWDPKLWENEVAPFLMRFSSALTHFMKDENAQMDYLRGETDERKEIIRANWIKDVHVTG